MRRSRRSGSQNGSLSFGDHLRCDARAALQQTAQFKREIDVVENNSYPASQGPNSNHEKHQPHKQHVLSPFSLAPFPSRSETLPRLRQYHPVQPHSATRGKQLPRNFASKLSCRTRRNRPARVETGLPPCCIFGVAK